MAKASSALPAVGAGAGLTCSLLADVAYREVDQLMAASSVGNEPRALVTLRSWKLIDSIRFVV